MDLRTLRYFLAVARDENMTRAAERLRVTQPTLSKALKSLEDELGKKLFVRHAFNISLTEEGLLLRDRARELVGLADKMEQEFRDLDEEDGGELFFGVAETPQVGRLAREIRAAKAVWPSMRAHLSSGDGEDLADRLDAGLVDFAVLCTEPDPRKYDRLAFPQRDVWGLVMANDDPLTEKEAVTVDDLEEVALFSSAEGWEQHLPRWCGEGMAELAREGSFARFADAATTVREGLGCLLAPTGLADVSPGSGLAFRPLEPALETPVYLAWKRDRTASAMAQRFLDRVKTSFELDCE